MTDPTSLSGRELDYAVGRALGYYVYHYSKGLPVYWCLMDAEGDPVNWNHRENERASEAEAWEQDCPCFSADLAAAWPVVEHVYATTSVWLLVKPCSGRWTAWDEAGECRAEGSSAPEAWCRAALLVLGGEA